MRFYRNCVRSNFAWIVESLESGGSSEEISAILGTVTEDSVTLSIPEPLLDKVSL